MATIKTRPNAELNILTQFLSVMVTGWTVVCALSLAWLTQIFLGMDEPWISRAGLVWGHAIVWVLGNGLFLGLHSHSSAYALRAEEKLRESEQRLRAVLDHTPVCMNLKDSGGRYLVVNKPYEDWLGHSSEELFGKTAAEMLADPVEVAKLAEAEKRVLETGKPIEMEVAVPRNGKIHHRILIKFPVASTDGSINAIGTVAVDITDRKKTEQNLRQHAIIWEQMSDAVVVHDAEGRILDCNPGAERVFGYAKEEFVGEFSDIFVKEDVPGTRRHEIKEAIKKNGFHSDHTRFIRKDGREGVMEAQIMPLFDVDGEVVGRLGVNRDITERLQTEERLRQSQKMEAVGQLTGGVAHDFNNLLAIVSLNMGLLQEEISGKPELDELVGRSLGAVRRGATLTQRLLSFSRRQSLSPEPTDLGRLIAEIEDMLRRTLGETIEVRIKQSDDTWRILVDAHQLESAIINLALNARDAMPAGGVLTIETVNAPLDEENVAAYDEVEVGDYVQLAISDTGTGIPRDELEHVFEPFFTTKDVGKGSGLGLSMVYGFVKQSKGHVTIYSEVGEGTSVKLFLPKDTSQEVDMVSAEDEVIVRHKGHERILVVEDEKDVRRGSVQTLRKAGYEIIEATNGPEALEEIRRSDPIDLLFTDVVLPKGMNGLELAEKAEGLQPGLNVLFTTGYAANAVIHQGRLAKKANLISKPYRRSELLERVRLLIDDPAKPEAGHPL
ncbi:MAG: PAS domain S-box protein [Rhodospirillales bacterium]|jgi:PAS domain S-box-containing protein|nr:PAS domain S-box protein [Rhodospirillales bacterium]